MEFSEIFVSLNSSYLETVPEGKPEVNATSCSQIILRDSGKVGVDFKFYIVRLQSGHLSPEELRGFYVL